MIRVYNVTHTMWTQSTIMSIIISTVYYNTCIYNRIQYKIQLKSKSQNNRLQVLYFSHRYIMVVFSLNCMYVCTWCINVYNQNTLALIIQLHSWIHLSSDTFQPWLINNLKPIYPSVRIDHNYCIWKWVHLFILGRCFLPTIQLRDALPMQILTYFFCSRGDRLLYCWKVSWNNQTVLDMFCQVLHEILLWL